MIELSFDKCKNSGFPSLKKSLKEKIFDNKQQILNNIIHYLNVIISEYIGKKIQMK